MRFAYILLSFFFAASLQVDACTTAIISGKFTPDGRPLLYKQRDTNFLDNKLMHFTDGRYSYVGVVNSVDKEGKEVWGGYNSAGFAIMNSASYNINPTNDGNKEYDGAVMKKALQECATLADFEKLIKNLPKPMELSSNFGVIDAQGGAAYYETNNEGFVKFDANDINTAPLGYIIRTNYSFSGERSRDLGLSRYQAAADRFYKASMIGDLTPRFLLQDISRNLKHGTTGIDLYDMMPANGDKPLYFPFRDFNPRYLTASAIVVQGVADKQPAEQTVMWTILGSPLTTPAVPIWLNKDAVYPTVMLADETGNAKLCDWGLRLKKKLFPINRGEGNDYINVAALISADGEGILQKTIVTENRLFNRTKEFIESVNGNVMSPNALADFYDGVDYFLDYNINDREPAVPTVDSVRGAE